MSFARYISLQKGGGKNMLTWFNGKKSYLGAFALFVLGGLKAVGVIDEQTFTTLAALVAGWSVYALRSAIKKVE